jgi:hypothetical protein
MAESDLFNSVATAERGVTSHEDYNEITSELTKM